MPHQAERDADETSSMIVTPRPAATLVLFRDPPANRGGEPELLMVERHGKANFGAGAFVFPGGVLEPEDCTANAHGRSQGLAPEQAAAAMADTLEPDKALGMHIAAIRETFEETLLLLAEPEDGGAAPPVATDSERLHAVRDRINRNELDFFDWLAGEKLMLPTGQLVYFAHWVTPEGLPIRFSTHFFACRCPEGRDVSTDDNEVVHHLWASPSDLLARQSRGELHLMDPTIRNLEVLAGHPDAATALEALAGRSFDTIMPKLQRHEDGSRTIVYPWDDLYHQI